MKKSLYNDALKQWKKDNQQSNVVNSMELVFKEPKKRGVNIKGNNKNFKTV